jgi:adenine-specific DNA methylase
MGLKRSLFDLDLSHASLTQHQLIMIKSMIIVSSSWIGCSNYVHFLSQKTIFQKQD